MDELKRKKYVYIVIGICQEYDGFAYRIVNETPAYGTLRKAKEEIRLAKQKAKAEVRLAKQKARKNMFTKEELMEMNDIIDSN